MNLNRTKKIAGEYIFLVIAFVMGVVYVTTSMLTSELGTINPFVVLGNSLLFILLSIMVGYMFSVQGTVRGTQTAEYIDAVKRKVEMNTAVLPYIQRLQEFCNDKNAKSLKDARMEILSVAGLAYEDHFDENGVAIGQTYLRLFFLKKHGKTKPEDIENHEKYKAFESAKKVKILKITPRMVMTSTKLNPKPKDMNVTIEGHLWKSNLQGIISKLAVAIVLGMFTVDTVVNFSFALLLWRVLEIAITMGTSYLVMQKSYRFVKIEYTNRINDKSDILREFLNLHGDKVDDTTFSTMFAEHIKPYIEKSE